ncbi:MAG TPA: palindromic element RPE3 domain-containing protein [Rickettsia endosymbiont of Bembidion lapponicum]|nr:palindromic element RPE3 domain-containing protein [Rickettsia endosymbiont of Bembidion lapponicum]
MLVQHVSKRSRQDEFKGEPAQRSKLREYRQILQNSLVSTFMECAVLIK